MISQLVHGRKRPERVRPVRPLGRSDCMQTVCRPIMGSRRISGPRYAQPDAGVRFPHG